MKAYQMAAHDEDNHVNDAKYVYNDFRVHGYICFIVLQSKSLITYSCQRTTWFFYITLEHV